MSAENDNKPLEEVKAPEAQAEETTQEVCAGCKLQVAGCRLQVAGAGVAAGGTA